jgi:hypothetical protein
MQFKSQSEDILIISRKNSLLGKRKIITQDIEVNQKMRDVVAKRLKSIDLEQEWIIYCFNKSILNSKI